jgi:hypothetical protein
VAVEKLRISSVVERSLLGGFIDVKSGTGIILVLTGGISTLPMNFLGVFPMITGVLCISITPLID